MKSRSKIITVIPVYKSYEELSENEKKSFHQVLKILENWDIAVVGPQDFNFKDYQKAAQESGKKISAEEFSRDYFRSAFSYNQLLLSRTFFKTFSRYEKLLIYQLDAWIFRDDLAYWEKQKIDYVGAPHFDGYAENQDYKMLRSQNGGFSIRSTAKSAEILKRVEILRKVYKRILFTGMGAERISNLIFKLYKKRLKLKSAEYFKEILPVKLFNEDRVWSEIFAKTFSDYQVASTEEAIKFAFEVHPEYLYGLNGNILPMGCHAWEQHNPEFWKQFIHE